MASGATLVAPVGEEEVILTGGAAAEDLDAPPGQASPSKDLLVCPPEIGSRPEIPRVSGDRPQLVPEADREKIFEPFHTGKTQGTGLGLAVARRVVESHGGTLSVLSAPSGGALFRAEIPES